MAHISAFVGHSFSDEDATLVRKFTDYFNSVRELDIGFNWTHAERAEPKELSEKIKEIIEGKNLFIGICTRKELVVDTNFTRRFGNYLLTSRAEIKAKTSDWIIQEIGFAYGRGMNIILFLEEGLRTPGGLYGNIEYIPFTRTDPEKSFNKFLQMIKALVATAQQTADETPDTINMSASETGTSDQGQPLGDRSKETLLNEIIAAIQDKNSPLENELSEKYLTLVPGEIEYEMPALQARRLYFHHESHGTNNFSELLKLSSEHPKHDFVYFALAAMYADYKDYQLAAENAEKSANLSLRDEDIARRLSFAIEYYAKANNPRWEKIALEISQETTKQYKATVLAALAKVYRQAKKWELFFATSEAALHMDPGDHSTRFNLAFQYSERLLHTFAYYHYRILADANPNETVWNNLGVAATNLGMKLKGINAYRKSEKANGTLAMSNIAYALINAGFKKEAEETISQALAIPNYDKNIGGAISELHRKMEEESEKEIELLEQIEATRTFLASFAQLRLGKPIEITRQVFYGESGQLFIEATNGILSASLKPGESNDRAQIFLSPLSERDAITGKTVGHTCVYKRTFSEGEKTDTIEGLLVFSEDGNQVSLLEGSLTEKPKLAIFFLHKQEVV